MSAGSKCTAKFNYQAVDGEELTIAKGETLVVVDDKGTWWKVRNQMGRMGLVPSNYVELMTSAVPTGGGSSGIGGGGGGGGDVARTTH